MKVLKSKTGAQLSFLGEGAEALFNKTAEAVDALVRVFYNRDVEVRAFTAGSVNYTLVITDTIALRVTDQRAVCGVRV